MVPRHQLSILNCFLKLNLLSHIILGFYFYFLKGSYIRIQEFGFNKINNPSSDNKDKLYVSALYVRNSLMHDDFHDNQFVQM